MNKKRFKYEYGLIWNENGEKFDVNECEGRRLVCEKLNEQQSTISQLQKKVSEPRFILCQDDFGNYEIRYDDEVFHFLWEVAPILNEQQATIQSLKEENEQLRKQCFELEKDYVIETSDISDRIYLDDEIKELKQKYGVEDE